MSNSPIGKQAGWEGEFFPEKCVSIFSKEVLKADSLPVMLLVLLLLRDPISTGRDFPFPKKPMVTKNRKERFMGGKLNVLKTKTTKVIH